MEDIQLAITRLKARYPKKKIVPYIPVRKYTPFEVTKLLQIYKDSGIDELLILAGGKFDDAEVRGAFLNTAEFLEGVNLKSFGIAAIGVAAHPQHHFCMNAHERMDALVTKYHLAKQQNLDIYFVTQAVCNPNCFVEWQKEVRKKGIDSKIYYGTLLTEVDPITYQRFMIDSCKAITIDPSHPDYDEESICIMNSPAEYAFKNTIKTLTELEEKVDGFHLYLLGGNLQITLDSLTGIID